MTLTPESRSALHELLDLSLNSDNNAATVFFDVSAHCGSIQVNIHEGGWVADIGPTKSFWISPSVDETAAEKTLNEVKEFLAQCKPKSDADKKAERIAYLRAELAEAEREVAEEILAEPQDWADQPPPPEEHENEFSVHPGVVKARHQAEQSREEVFFERRGE